MSNVGLEAHGFVSAPEGISEARLIVMGESRSVVNFLEKVSSGVHLSVNLLGLAFKSPSAFLSSLEVIYFLETLSLVDMGE